MRGGAEARLTVCGRDGRGTCDSGFGILFSLDRDEKLTRNKGRNRCAASQLYEAPQEGTETTFTSGPPIRLSAGLLRSGPWHNDATAKKKKKRFSAEDRWDCFILENLSISFSLVNPENILAVVISIEKYEDKLVTIPVSLYRIRKCHIALENVLEIAAFENLGLEKNCWGGSNEPFRVALLQLLPCFCCYCFNRNGRKYRK